MKNIEFEPQFARMQAPKPKKQHILLRELAYAFCCGAGMTLAILIIGLIVE